MSKVELQNAKYRREIEDLERKMHNLKIMVNGLGTTLVTTDGMKLYMQGWDDAIRSIRRAMALSGMDN